MKKENTHYEINTIHELSEYRDNFTKILKNYFKDNLSLLLDKIEEGYSNSHFICFIEDIEVYIIYKHNYIIINWYKLNHIGRCLRSNCANFNIIKEILSELYFTFKEDIIDDIRC